MITTWLKTLSAENARLITEKILDTLAKNPDLIERLRVLMRPKP
jgi:hypothetical protein